MTSTTKWYNALRDAYEEQAELDRKEIAASVRRLCGEIKGSPSISDDMIQTFCKNCWYVRAYRSRSYEDEVTSPKTDTLKKNLESDLPLLGWYLLLRAADHFHKETGHYPGSAKEGMETDVSQYTKIATQLYSDSGLAGTSPVMDHVQEMLRYGGAELHNISAVMGGVVAQEAIKIITGQRLVVDNTFLFDGASCEMTTAAL
eukprot:NODE_394_length_1550_cov_52.977512_g362_i0.p1 GENE.NODE_394_length_1550_cov_52.977512_g362_i0~~NODE_394_length_1550_cov_52.977512_g362_i0.p1  ORF type:complete len:202 (-),score=28.31 NODE_394_length_1550_cov_52.977512_g362_i0:59-664(-)